jgi:hypothetical protein
LITRVKGWIVAGGIAGLALALANADVNVPVIAATPSTEASGAADPVYGITIPPGYRDWRLISVATLGSPFDDIRAKLGNDIAIDAFRAGTLPFPDGAIIVRLAWKQVMDRENADAFRQDAGAEHVSAQGLEKLLSGSFVAGPATNVQIMVKDSKRYASTGGWGFAQFTNGKPDSAAVQNTCWPCHAPAKNRDFVFTRYAP